MKTYEKLGDDALNGRISSYTESALDALKSFFQCDAAIVDDGIVEKENFIDNSRIVFLMNIKRMKDDDIDQQYAFFYISLEKDKFYKFSELVCKKNNMPCDSANVRISAVKECCNRIGARLLRFIEEKEYSFDIGTPILMPMSSKILRGDTVDLSKLQLWPFNFYKEVISIDDIPINFGCTILESPEQRHEIITKSVMDMVPEGSEIVIEREVPISDCPPVFDLHYLITLVTDEQVVASFSKKYLADSMMLFEIGGRSNEERKDAIMNYIRENINVRDIEECEGGYPSVPEDCLVKILKVSRYRYKVHMAINVVM